MKFAIYRGAVVEVEEEREKTVYIRDDFIPAIVSKDDIVGIPDGIIDELLQELSSTRTQISDFMNRMQRLDTEYHKKIESLREMYLDARSQEMILVVHILKNSQVYCQK